MLARKTKESQEEKHTIETVDDGNILFRVPHLIPHMTRPDRVEIIAWHIKEGDIVKPDDAMVTFDFLGDDWHICMPPLGPVRVLKIIVPAGTLVHLHDPLLLLAPVPSAASS